jgi:2-oxoglutarate dehydrogenase E2 component (dihydrolipoamide succinyltransferase)
MADVEMPQLGETVTEGTITKWFKAVGESVAQDEVLFEVSTDKVDSEVPSPAAGYLAEILVPEGETVDVGTRLAVLSDAPPSGAGAAPAAEAAAAEAPAQEAPAQEAPTAPAEAPAAAPTAAAHAPEAPAAPSGPPKLLSPLVRRLIEDHGLDAGAITGTGIGGRITRGDVEAVIDLQRGSAPATRPAPAAAAPAAASAPPPVRSGSPRDDRVEKLNHIRVRTGEHMVRSKATSPHVLTAVEVDFESVEKVRRSHGASFKVAEGFSLTYLPFISRAVVDAIEEFPHLNAAVGDGELIVHGRVNLAYAVDLDFQGLLAPVVHDADAKRLTALAREIHDLAARARSKQLSPDDLAEGTFTITNPGKYGTMMQFPVINQPQVAILSTDGIHRKPVVVTDANDDEAIAIHSVGVLALAWDHRAFDGAYVAAFLDRLREIIQTRDWVAEL